MVTKRCICLLIPLFFAICSPAQSSTLIPSIYSASDSVVTVASTRYKPNSFLRRLLMGTNYREEWSMPVVLPVFRLSKSGFVVQNLGGGMQTKSLQLRDKLGKEWALRTVDKDVEGAMPSFLRNSLAQRASQDLISAAFPYGAPIIGELANAAGIIAARPQIFFVAADSSLGAFQSVFANTVCMLEERDPGFDSTINTITVLENTAQSNQYKIQQKVLLKARLFDVMIADWDRHADNWRWGRKDSAGVLFYYPVPRDRDWAFYQSKGWIPQLAQRTKAMRHLVNFTPSLKKIKDLSWKAWLLDKTFLNELDKTDWDEAIKELQEAMTDSVIKTAVQKLPAAIYATSGSTFIEKLKERRNQLAEEAIKYYRFISEEIIINGSNENETFLIRSGENKLIVSVYAKNSDKNILGEKIYERIFNSGETYLITINGLGGADTFQVEEKATSKIRLRIVGGEGDDSYDLGGSIRIKVDDMLTENNTVINKGNAKLHFR